MFTIPFSPVKGWLIHSNILFALSSKSFHSKDEMQIYYHLHQIQLYVYCKILYCVFRYLFCFKVNIFHTLYSFSIFYFYLIKYIGLFVTQSSISSSNIYDVPVLSLQTILFSLTSVTITGIECAGLSNPLRL